MINNLFRLLNQIMKLRLGMATPIVADFYLTDKCNLSCIVCDMWHRIPHSEIKKENLEHFFRDSMIFRKLLFINLSGGEVFVLAEPHEYVFTILKYAKPLTIRFATNGYNTEQIIASTRKILKYTKLKLGFRISVDGSREMHDYVRGKEGAFDQAVKTIESLVKLRKTYNNLSINIGFTVNALNFNEIEKVHILSDKLKVGFTVKPVQDTKIFLVSRDLDESLSVRADMEGYITARLKNVKVGHMPFSEKLVHSLLHAQFIKYLKCKRRTEKCYAGNATFFLLPSGDVGICFINNYIIGNLHKESFDKVWHSGKVIDIRKRIANNSCRCLCNTETMSSTIIQKFPFYF